MERQQDYVLRSVEERGVRLVRLWFTDVLGNLKSFAITPAELENAFEEGMHFDGSDCASIEWRTMKSPRCTKFRSIASGLRRSIARPCVTSWHESHCASEWHD